MQTLYSGGLVFDGEGRLLENYGLLVENGLIVKLAPRQEFIGFAGYVVDTAGGTLMPGLIDAHVRLAYGAEFDPMHALAPMNDAHVTLRVLEHAQASLVGGVTSLRDFGGRSHPTLAVRDVVRQGRFVAPDMICVGQAIAMTGGHEANLSLVADGTGEIVKHTRYLASAQVDVVALAGSGGVMSEGTRIEDSHFTFDEINAGVAEATRLRRKTAVLAHNNQAAKFAVDAGVNSIEHGVHLEDDTILAMVERGVYLVPTLSPVVAMIDNADQPLSRDMLNKARQVSKTHARALKRFYDAGGKVAMGSDAGTPYNPHGENARELALMVQAGMTPIDALIAATGHAADLLGLASHGRLKNGAVADLLVVDGNPADDIRAVADRSNHRIVVKNGQVTARRG